MRALFVAVTFIATSAFAACPNLAGNYKVCKNIAGETVSADMIVQQSIQNKVTVYNVSVINQETQQRESEVYKTDGKMVSETYEDPETGIQIEAQMVSACIGNALDIKMNLNMGGQTMGWTKIKVTKNGKQIIVDSVNFDGEQEITDKEICE
jgi:hypothetical protein